MDTCAPGRLWPLRVFLVIVGLQDVAVLGHHEDRDEVNDSKGQKLSLLTVLLKQTKSTKRPGSWVKLLNAWVTFTLDSQHLWRQQPWGGWCPCPEEACPNLSLETIHLSLHQPDSAGMNITHQLKGAGAAFTPTGMLINPCALCGGE